MWSLYDTVASLGCLAQRLGIRDIGVVADRLATRHAMWENVLSSGRTPIDVDRS